MYALDLVSFRLFENKDPLATLRLLRIFTSPTDQEEQEFIIVCRRETKDYYDCFNLYDPMVRLLFHCNEVLICVF